jgi:hypothetical protein
MICMEKMDDVKNSETHSDLFSLLLWTWPHSGNIPDDYQVTLVITVIQ